MQEFSSVTASSYDADSLTPLLNERAAEGWNVVSIVAAGTNIVAYLSREGSGTSDSGDVDTDATAGAGLLGLDVEAPADETPADETPTDDVADQSDWAGAVTSDQALAVDEPAGWATAPEESTTDDSIAALATQIGQDDVAATEPVVETTPSAEPVLAAAEPAVAEPVVAEPAVPAGWYADPSGRFELRYWDGTAWTEHVSRAGQQFTDPPVA